MIKNYTSNSKQTFDKIQKILIDHKAKSIMFEYDENGKIKTLNFLINVNGVDVSFQLPARVDKVEQLFYKNKKRRYDWQQPSPLTDSEKDQAYRTAWANIRDWLDAQMALIDTEQVKLEEVFLPYAKTNGKTFFEVMESKSFNLELGNGTEEGIIL